jgi:hypothetical protein
MMERTEISERQRAIEHLNLSSSPNTDSTGANTAKAEPGELCYLAAHPTSVSFLISVIRCLVYTYDR